MKNTLALLSRWSKIHDRMAHASTTHPIFPENRVIKATKFAITVMPAVAVISVLMQIAFVNYAGLPQAMIMALFALSLPLQGLWWLGAS